MLSHGCTLKPRSPVVVIGCLGRLSIALTPVRALVHRFELVAQITRTVISGCRSLLGPSRKRSLLCFWTRLMLPGTRRRHTSQQHSSSSATPTGAGNPDPFVANGPTVDAGALRSSSTKHPSCLCLNRQWSLFCRCPKAMQSSEGTTGFA